MVPLTRRPTQADVARRAGVSRGTVSLVLNNRGGRVLISTATREKVLAAARELGYSPNPVAQMLASGRNRIIGFFTFEETFPYGQEDFHHRYLVGVERSACARDFDLLLFTRGGRDQPKTIYRAGMNSLRLADGSIFIGTDPDPEGLQRLLEENYPFVLIGRTRIPPTASTP
jgi:DNA-binding LacI/PurR family transcriptional regulator